ncbi:MAG: GNAT family N-acetyltransferase [Chitinophagaceae bacterium]|nr:GNAT family N-acetyltransferase [Chitinophagaceae bacterium]
MKIRQASVKDAGPIATICHSQFHIAHKVGIAPDDLLYYVDKTFSKAAVEADLSNTENIHFVAIGNDEDIVGCINIGKVHLPQASHMESAMEITRLYIKPEYIGKGVASALMEKVKTLARSKQKESLWLHVYKGNEVAIKFYNKCRFNIVGELNFPVRQSCPVGWVMMCKL